MANVEQKGVSQEAVNAVLEDLEALFSINIKSDSRILQLADLGAALDQIGARGKRLPGSGYDGAPSFARDRGNRFGNVCAVIPLELLGGGDAHYLGTNSSRFGLTGSYCQLGTGIAIPIWLAETYDLEGCKPYEFKPDTIIAGRLGTSPGNPGL